MKKQTVTVPHFFDKAPMTLTGWFWKSQRGGVFFSNRSDGPLPEWEEPYRRITAAEYAALTAREYLSREEAAA